MTPPNASTRCCAQLSSCETSLGLTAPEHMLAEALTAAGNKAKPDAIIPFLDRVIANYPEYPRLSILHVTAQRHQRRQRTSVPGRNPTLAYFFKPIAMSDEQRGSLDASIVHGNEPGSSA